MFLPGGESVRYKYIAGIDEKTIKDEMYELDQCREALVNRVRNVSHETFAGKALDQEM